MRNALALFSAALLAAGCSPNSNTGDTTALAKRLCEVTHIPEAIESGRDEQIASIKSSFAANTNLSAEVLQTVDGMIATIAKVFTWENIQEEYVHIYDGVFTANELREIIAFYESPVGRKYVAKMPEIQNRQSRFFIRLASQTASNRAMPMTHVTLEPDP